MQKRFSWLFFLGCAALSVTTLCVGHEGHSPEHDLAATTTTTATTSTDANSPSDLKKVSEAFGNSIGKILVNPNAGIQFDIESVIKGIRDGVQGKPSPLSEQEYEKAIMSFQESAFKNLSEKNLKSAEEFMTQNRKEQGIVVVEPGKLHYVILKEGAGAPLKENSSPLVNYTGKFQDGTVFGSSEEMGPITIQLDKTIPGFTKGLLGMKKGEKRRLFIHPDLAYGTRGDLPPNALLIFDVEVVSTEGKDADRSSSMQKGNDDDDDDDETPKNDKDKGKNPAAPSSRK